VSEYSWLLVAYHLHLERISFRTPLACRANALNEKKEKEGVSQPHFKTHPIANDCKRLQTIANDCKPLQTIANHCKPLQT
jgi:hypothetical protein